MGLFYGFNASQSGSDLMSDFLMSSFRGLAKGHNVPVKFGASSSRNKSASNITAAPEREKRRFECDDEFSVSDLFVTFFYFT